jgi:hypothetical protein
MENFVAELGKVNGNLFGFFNSSCGLRLGDLLFPFLFVIVMEALSKMLFSTIDGDFLSGFFVGSRHSVVCGRHFDLSTMHITPVVCGQHFDFLFGHS